MDERQDADVGQEPAPPIRDEIPNSPNSHCSYQPPMLERLGEWRALTLQQSVGIGFE